MKKRLCCFRSSYHSIFVALLSILTEAFVILVFPVIKRFCSSNILGYFSESFLLLNVYTVFVFLSLNVFLFWSRISHYWTVYLFSYFRSCCSRTSHADTKKKKSGCLFPFPPYSVSARTKSIFFIVHFPYSKTYAYSMHLITSKISSGIPFTIYLPPPFAKLCYTARTLAST